MTTIDPHPTAPPTVAPATELRPCPFCGRSPKSVTLGERLYGASCDTVKCGNYARGYRLDYWNLRPLEDSDRADVDRLRARVAELEATLSGLETRIFALGSDSPICRLHRLKLSALVDFIHAALKPEPASR